MGLEVTSKERLVVVMASLVVVAFVRSQIATAEGVGRKLSAGSLQACLASAGARTVFPGSADYKSARIEYNLRNLYNPAAFVYPTSVAQVQNAVFCSIQVGVGIVPRGGGHSFEDYALGGRDGVLVVDMQGFKQLIYDEASKTATVGAGWRLGPLYLALWNAGKVTLPAGLCPTVGIAGHALGGGYGFSSRKFGVVSDTILELQVVTANGTVVTANADQNSELYFALRGAGATSFGIVTEFKFRMNDVSHPATYFNYTWMDPTVEHTNFKAFQKWAVDVPSEISASFFLSPSGLNYLEGVYMGPKSSLAPLLKKFLRHAAANPSSIEEELTWLQVVLVGARFNSRADPTVLNNVALPTNTFKGKSIYVKKPGLSDHAIKAMIKAMRAGPNNNSYFVYDVYGSQSAINQKSPGESAFVHRNSLFCIQMMAYWADSNGELAGTNYIDNYWNVLREYTSGEAYQNFIDGDMPLTAYYGSNLKALIAEKRKWDPTNVFNFPMSIPLK